MIIITHVELRLKSQSFFKGSEFSSSEFSRHPFWFVSFGLVSQTTVTLVGLVSQTTGTLLGLISQCADQVKTSTSPPPPPGKPRAFELFKIGSFKFPPPRAKMVFKCPTLSSHFVCQIPLLKNNRRRFLSSVRKLVYIRGTQRYQFKRESYFRRWLRGLRYTLRTRNTY